MGRSEGTGARLMCSFCNKSQDEVRKLIAGPNVYICDECIELCNDIIAEEWEEEQARLRRRDPVNSADLARALDAYLLGQDHAKDVIAAAVFLHRERVKSEPPSASGQRQTANILLIGPPGSGKALIVQAVAGLLGEAITTVDANAFIGSGDSDAQAEATMQQLLQAADFDIVRAQRGIVYVDGIHRLSRRREDGSLAEGGPGEAGQRALARLLGYSGAPVELPGEPVNGEKGVIVFDTANVLFVFGGSFARGMAEVPEQETLVAQGLIPELVGRLPVIVRLDHESGSSLDRILPDPRNVVMKEYRKHLDLLARPYCRHQREPWCCSTSDNRRSGQRRTGDVQDRAGGP